MSFGESKIHMFSKDGFKVVHLNLDEKVFFSLKNKSDMNIIGLSIVDLITIIPKLKTNGTFEISDSSCFSELKDKSTIKFVVSDKTLTCSGYVMDSYLGGKNKHFISVEMNVSEVLDIIKEIVNQMVLVYQFYRSNIDWTKNEKEKQKSNELGKFITKLKKYA